ncbi:PspC domain-containing protein [Flavobacterium sp. '19STA2R22 D10 B1']|uniref:PspC domain-containing protein n=1 Tax=Flavobacterium aerium TaxID=3037261 RepID=UPI00278C16A2|nr:PspC domain-containing protein [Flavobacterium sp. '19STA2R22 D10 B1']
MNKTVNINLGGMFFHIDEDAYHKLTFYFDSIKRSLSDSNGQEEIMNDIEIRISELLTEMLKNEKQVVSIKEVDQIIGIMGQPEDYRIDDATAPEEQPRYQTPTGRISKKLYRDKEKGIAGGVSAGFSHYIGIDPLWIRIIMIILLFSYGAGFLIYILLWILIPPALTTTEKLEMTGEPINISNIEKKVKEGFDNVSEKIKNADYDKMGNSAKTGLERLFGSLGEIFMSFFNIFSKLIGIMLIFTAAVTLVGLFISMFTLGSTSIVHVPWMDYYDTINYTNTPMWAIGLLFFFAIGIPFFFLFILGLKLLVTNMKSIGNVAKYTLLAIWLIAIALLVFFGVKQATEVAFDGKTVHKEIINISESDTLFVKIKNSDYYSKSVSHRSDFKFVQDSLNNDLIYSNNIELHFLITDEQQPFIQIEKIAEGKSLTEAKSRAEQIHYSYKIEGNHLIFDNFLLTNISNKYRSQEVKIFVYLPKGQIIYPDESIQNYHRSYYSDSNLNIEYGNENNYYKVDKNEIKCLTCPIEDNVDDSSDDSGEYSEHEEINDNDTTGTNVIINDRGIKIKNNKKGSNNKQVESLEINKNGVIIKAK